MCQPIVISRKARKIEALQKDRQYSAKLLFNIERLDDPFFKGYGST